MALNNLWHKHFLYKLTIDLGVTLGRQPYPKFTVLDWLEELVALYRYFLSLIKGSYVRSR